MSDVAKPTTSADAPVAPVADANAVAALIAAEGAGDASVSKEMFEKIQSMLASRDKEYAELRAKKEQDEQRIAALEKRERDEMASWVDPSVKEMEALTKEQTDPISQADIARFAATYKNLSTMAGNVEDARAVGRTVYAFSKKLAEQQAKLNELQNAGDSLKTMHEQISTLGEEKEKLNKENEELKKRKQEADDLASKYYKTAGVMQQQLALHENGHMPLVAQHAFSAGFSDIFKREKAAEPAESTSDPLRAFTQEMSALGSSASRMLTQDADSHHRILGYNPSATALRSNNADGSSSNDKTM